MGIAAIQIAVCDWQGVVVLQRTAHVAVDVIADVAQANHAITQILLELLQDKPLQ